MLLLVMVMVMSLLVFVVCVQLHRVSSVCSLPLSLLFPLVFFVLSFLLPPGFFVSFSVSWRGIVR
ncbi:hypothetical protein BCY88_33420 [Paraburkholderia fungorum]|uniref:Uncharacterized protein n=1 Tax=Paraburkholderia fungorum TaxID=134537 RepID=A0A3R7GQU9_9BURK|nr:hypothetical protein BCY88_33420 [Paraburkholderia fungorum]